MNRIYLLIIFFIMLPYIMLSQVMYNISKPYSYHQNGLKANNELPLIHFPINEEGNLIENNINFNIKDKAIVELINNKYVSRFKIKVFAEKLGMMSIIMDKVVLNNNSYCYVYTPDYQIVAGPIYQGSINDFLIIKDIPTDELIVEVISNSVSDYELNLSEVNYFSMFSKKNRDKYDVLLSDTTEGYTCNYGKVQYYEDTQIIDAYKCGEYGYTGSYNIFNSDLRSITDYQFAAARASCIIYHPLLPNDNEYNKGFRNYTGERGTLINFPYTSCGNNTDNDDDCGVGIVVGMYHNGLGDRLVEATDSNDYEYLDKILVRFNLFHKYGTPWHLKDIECTADSNSFKKWRESIDFSEVIDYCGVRLLLYDIRYYSHADIFMIKMNQKPFYKELHLGWTTENMEGRKDKQFLGIGNHGISPTYAISGSRVSATEMKLYGINGLSGLSGSIYTMNDYQNYNERIAIGMIQRGSGNDVYTYNFNSAFAQGTVRFYLDANCINQGFDVTGSILNYLNKSKFTGIVKDSLGFKWMPSKENKEKCQSKLGKRQNKEGYYPCSPRIYDYIPNSDSLCIKIDSIPDNIFPDKLRPAGYRIYHNYGIQSTILFKSFNDDQDSIYPIIACIDTCDLLYLISLGRDSVDLALEFYDSTGRVINNPNCDSLFIKYKIPISICDIINKDNIVVEKVSTFIKPVPLNPLECCKYRISINLTTCDNEQVMMLIIDSLKFNNISITELPNVEIDYNSKLITFYQDICPDNNVKPILKYSNKLIECLIELDEYPFCSCDCSPKKSYKANWFELTLTPGGDGTNCNEDQCAVSGTIDIPEFYNCPDNPFTHYSISPYHFLKHIIPEDNIISGYQTSSIGCLNKGEARYDTIKLYRGIGDNNPCEISKLIYCPLEDNTNPCTPDCDTAKWEAYRFDNWLPLPGCPDCKVIASYVARKNPCTGMQEIQIIKFETYSSDPQKSACASCNISIDDIYKIVLKKAIYDNEMAFEPILDKENLEDSLCNDTWRVVQGACWVTYIDYLFQPEGGVRVYKPCDSVECCSVGLRVCRYYMGDDNPQKVTIETLDGTNPNDCIGFTQAVFDPNGFQNPIYHPDGSISYNTTTTLPCQSRCNWLYGLADTAIYAKQSFNYDNVTNYSNDDNEIGLKVNINEDYLDLSITSGIPNRDLIISIYSLQGQKLLTQGYKVRKGLNHVKIYTQDFISGVYFIILQADGLIFKAEKLIIIK